MKIKELRDKNWIIFEAVSGSRAYGTDLPTSDTDIRGIFIQPTEEVLMANPTVDGNYPYISQISDETNDITFFEIGRFIELLEKGNPNILELLNVPEECIIFKHPMFEKYFPNPNIYLTKQLRYTFLGYAKTQIMKAKGMNKKIHTPQPEIRKDILDFCYVIENNKSIPFWEFFNTPQKDKENFIEKTKNWAVVKIPNGEQLYAFYKFFKNDFSKGIIKDLNSANFRLSSVPKQMMEGTSPHLISFNLNGFQSHCKEHREYWDWVKHRNEARYKDNLKGQIGFDHKNMMHCVRLIEMAEDIVIHNKIIVRRPNRGFLLSIRNGELSYDEIMNYVEEKIEKIDNLFNTSNLAEKVDSRITRELLRKIRIENLKI